MLYERWPFGLQKMTFYRLKDDLLQLKRPSFGTLAVTY